MEHKNEKRADKSGGLVLPELENRFRASMEALDPDFREKSYLLGFSGGPDSLALALLLSRAVSKEKIILFHLDHAISFGSDARAREAGALADSLGVRFASRRADVPKLAAERGKGEEEAGRAARYQAFEEERERLQASWILTAHQEDDLAETILLKLIKGAGPGGLIGIPPKSGRLLRPLLGFSRSELQEAVLASGLAAVQDPENDNVKYARNYLRKRVVPLLKEINPAFARAFARLSSIARAEEELWEENLAGLCERLVAPCGENGYLIELDGFLSLKAAEQRRLLGRLLRLVPGIGKSGGEPLGLSAVLAALKFILEDKKKGEDLPSGRRIQRQGGKVLLRPASRSEV